MTPGPPAIGKVFGWATRRIDGVPVFSSRAVVGLTRAGAVGFMEVHWPEIPAAALFEAHRLDFKVHEGWRPPEREGITPESVQAGIIHSPAAGFVLDMYPAIRVIYSAKDGRGGKRLVLYFNRDGKVVPSPRQFDLVCDKEIAPRARPRE